MLYRVEVQEITTGFIDVEAESKEEAEDLAYTVFGESGAYWTDSEVLVLTASEME